MPDVCTESATGNTFFDTCRIRVMVSLKHHRCDGLSQTQPCEAWPKYGSRGVEVKGGFIPLPELAIAIVHLLVLLD